MKNIIVGQSGGPTAVINSSVAGVYKRAKELGINKVYEDITLIEQRYGLFSDKEIELIQYKNSINRTPSTERDIFLMEVTFQQEILQEILCKNFFI